MASHVAVAPRRWIRVPRNGVRPDGSGLKRVAALSNEQPYVAWSPDGRHVAVWGGIGLQIVDAASGAVRLLRNPVGTGPISWGY